MMPLGVATGVVVIAVAAAVVLVALIAALSMRGRGMRAAQRRSEVRRDLDQALDRADQAERNRDVARSQVEPTTDEPADPSAESHPDPDGAPGRGSFWRRR
jgi:Tfp pilus assembly protein PilX